MCFYLYLYIYYYLLRVQPKLPPPSPLFYVCVLYLILSRSVFILYHFSHAGRTVCCVYIPACDMGLLVLFSFYPIWALLWSGHLVCPAFVCPTLTCPTLVCPTLAYPLLQGFDSLPYFSLSVSCRGRTVCPVFVCLPQGSDSLSYFILSSTADNLSYFSLFPARVRQLVLFLVCLPQRTVCPI